MNLAGKKAICFGDSITWYDGQPYNWGKEAGKRAIGFESYLREAGMTVRNEGISNGTLPVIRDHLLRTDLSGYDAVFLTSGANDSRYGIPCGHLAPKGSAFDCGTFYGCLQSCIEHIQRENRSAEIVLMTPVMGWIYAPEGYEYDRSEDGEVEACYAEAILSAGGYYGLPVCDWYHDSGICRETRERLINDPEPDRTVAVNPNPLYSLHPSAEGYRRMAEVLLRCLKG